MVPAPFFSSSFSFPPPPKNFFARGESPILRISIIIIIFFYVLPYKRARVHPQRVVVIIFEKCTATIVKTAGGPTAHRLLLSGGSNAVVGREN